MERCYSRINWQNEPSIATPINATNMNAADYAIYTIDGRVVGMDTTKANQSDLLTCLSGVDYNTSTGVFTFTWKSGTTATVDLNVEKIPVGFSMDANGIITMTTSDGTTYTADVGALIKITTISDSNEITWTVITDASGNKTWTGSIVNGSITGNKLQPNFLADCQDAKSGAETAATTASSFSLVSEGFANGTQNGTAVDSSSPYYHNNAKYWKEQAQGAAAGTLSALGDVSLSSPANNDILKYNSTTEKWENGEAPSSISVIDNLNSTSGTDALSAKQGKALNENTVHVSSQSLTQAQRKQARENIGVEQTHVYTIPSSAWRTTTSADMTELNDKLTEEFGVQTSVDETELPYMAEIVCTDFTDDTKTICEFPKITEDNLKLRAIVYYVYFTDTHIVLYATEQPTVSGVLSVKGE